MYQPPALKKGDTIGIVAPAGRIDARKIGPAIERFKAWGLNVVFGDNLLGGYHQFSGTDSQRKSDFQKMMDSPQIKAIVCARGGYGSIRIVNDLCFDGFMQNPKWVVGYSDVTVLHAYLNNVLGVESLHAIMPLNFPDIDQESDALSTLKSTLMGNAPRYELTGHSLNHEATSSGIVLGGNLSILYGLRGTKMDFSPQGKILFIEDVGEELYHLDRMMMNLKVSGVLKQLRGLIVGGMTDMTAGDPPFGQSANEIIDSAVGNCDYPVVYDFPAGHMADNRALILGRHIALESSKEKVILNPLL